MDVLKKTSAQLRELFVSMTPGARITSGLLLAVIVVGVALPFQQRSTDPDEYLFGGKPFASNQIPQVEAALATVGNDFRIENNLVSVPRSKRDAYLAALDDAGALPRNLDSIMSEALDGGSVMDSRETKRWRNQAARESQLSHLIGLMPWVEQASVIFTIEEPRNLSREQQASATVSVLPKPGELLDGRRIRDIQRIVAGSHPRLHREKVTVINLGQESHATELTAEDFNEDYWRLRISYEELKRDNIQKVLSYIPGVRVQISASLEKRSEETVRDVKSDQRGVVTNSVADTANSLPTPPGGGPKARLDAHGPNGHRTKASIVGQTIPASTHCTKEENAAGFSESELCREGFKEKEVYASIAVPRDHIVQVWKQRNPHAEGQRPREPDDDELQHIQSSEISKIENLVKPLLPRPARGEDEYKQIHVEVVNSIPREPQPEQALAGNALAWTGRNWATLSVLGLAAFGILVLRSIVRSGPRGADRPTICHLAEQSPATTAPESDSDVPRQRLRPRKPHSLKQELAELIREDPDAAASVVRNWIRTAG